MIYQRNLGFGKRSPALRIHQYSSRGLAGVRQSPSHVAVPENEFIPPHVVDHPHTLIRQIRELRSVGVLRLIKEGKHKDLQQLEKQLVQVFQTGGEAHFVKKTGDQYHFSDLPGELYGRLPATLFLQGAAGQIERIATNSNIDNCTQAYINLDQIVIGTTDLSHDDLEAANTVISQGLSAAIVGHQLQDGKILITCGAEYFIAAREQGETHLLLNIKRGQAHPTIVSSNENEIDFIQIPSQTTRAERFRSIFAQMDPQIVLQQILDGSIHPELLAKLGQLIDYNAQANPAQSMLFLETILRQGIRANGKLKEPGETVIVVAGFGQEFGMMKVFLDFGYNVIGIEDFNLAGKDVGADLTPDSIMQEFENHPHVKNLKVLDFRDPNFPTGEADVVLFAAIIDEAFETVATLAKVGGIVAVTEMGRIDTKRENFVVDSPTSFIKKSADEYNLDFAVIYSENLAGRGTLPSHFINMKGHRAYIVKRRAQIPF